MREGATAQTLRMLNISRLLARPVFNTGKNQAISSVPERATARALLGGSRARPLFPFRHISLDGTNPIGYTRPRFLSREHQPGCARAQASSPAFGQRGRRGTHVARAVIPPHRRCTHSARRGRPDAAGLPLAPLATAGNGHGTTGRGTRGPSSARRQAAARQAGFPSCEPFPACRPVAARGHSPAGLSLSDTPCPKGRAGAPRHSAGPAARQALRLSCEAPNRRPPSARP
jgi:hypothetical protein